MNYSVYRNGLFAINRSDLVIDFFYLVVIGDILFIIGNLIFRLLGFGSFFITFDRMVMHIIFPHKIKELVQFQSLSLEFYKP